MWNIVMHSVVMLCIILTVVYAEYHSVECCSVAVMEKLE
jgi:hypothetical protein